MDKPDFLKYGNGHPFEECPKFYDHMCHWAPWADHFADDPDHDKRTLAMMLGYALGEKSRLLALLKSSHAARSQLLFAYIQLVETGESTTFRNEWEAETTLSIKDAWESIQLLNKWRNENKLNIMAVDGA